MVSPGQSKSDEETTELERWCLQCFVGEKAKGTIQDSWKQAVAANRAEEGEGEAGSTG